jgi:DNA modification methylase
MSGRVSIIVGDALTELRKLESDSVDMICTSPPYWGLRSYNVEGQLGQEHSLGEHLTVMVELFREARRALKPSGTCWINYGDCYASTPNGRSAADTKALSDDDRTFRDKPFSTVGPIYEVQPNSRQAARRGRSGNLGNGGINGDSVPEGRVVAGGYLKPKDLCMVPQRLFIALQEDGWFVRSILPWVKRNGMPDSITDRPANSIEYVALLTKSKRYFYDAEAVRRTASPNTNARVAQNVAAQAGSLSAHGGAKTNGPMKAVVRNRKSDAVDRRSGVRANQSHEAVSTGAVIHDRNFRNTDLFFDSLEEPWGLISDADGTPLALDVTPQAFRDAHFATFPPALVSPLIRAGCPVEGTVLDPFGGAGTTGLVAGRLQRNAILIELNPAYAEMARNRIAADLIPVAADIPQTAPAGPLFDGFLEAAE